MADIPIYSTGWYSATRASFMIMGGLLNGFATSFLKVAAFSAISCTCGSPGAKKSSSPLSWIMFPMLCLKSSTV